MDNQNQKSNLLPWIVVLALLIFIWFKSCSNGNSDINKPTIETKEAKGTFESKKPTHTPVSTEPKKLSTEPSKTNEAFYRSEMNRLLEDNIKLANAFNNASDSLKIAMHNKAIQVSEFSQTFDDDKLKATASGLVRGEVQTLKLDYTIKKQTIEVPKQKEVVFRMLVGIEAGNNTQFNSFNAKVNVGFQNRKGNIISASADMDKRYYIGYTIPIFSIKR